MSRRVLLAAVMHEANSFARRFAPLDHFRRQGVFLGDEIPARFGPTRTEMAGFLEAARAQGWRIETPIAVPTAPEGPVARDAYAFFRDRLAEGARRAMPLDGVLLALHGSMVAEGEDDGDGGLAQAVRDAVGPDVPISLTLDPHSNVSDRLAGAVNAITAYRTHPHTDHKETGLRAAETLTAMRTMSLERNTELLPLPRPRQAGKLGKTEKRDIAAARWRRGAQGGPQPGGAGTRIGGEFRLARRHVAPELAEGRLDRMRLRQVP